MPRRSFRIVKKSGSFKKRRGAIGKKSKAQRKRGSRRRIKMIRGGRIPIILDERGNKINVLIIDPQVDFHEGGGLAVEGADDDSSLIAQFLLDNTQNINKVFVSLDTHTPNHIGHPGYWKVVNEDGTVAPDQTAPKDYTVFSHYSDTAIKGSDGKFYAPKRAGEDILKWTINYVKNIATYGKGPALIWPTHCIETTEGHRVTPLLRDALKLLGNKVEYHIKGQNELSEMYSIFKAEIEVPLALSTAAKAYSGSESKLKSSSKIDNLSDVQDGVFLNTGYNTGLFTALVKDKYKIVVCGEALSHCANWSLRDLVEELIGRTTYTATVRARGLPEAVASYTTGVAPVKINKENHKVIVLANASSPVKTFGQNVDDLMMYCLKTGVTVARLVSSSNDKTSIFELETDDVIKGKLKLKK
jgi:nicotinamidase-related amidase